MPKVNMTVKLVTLIVLTFLWGHYVPLPIARACLAFSYTLKEVIVFVLPVIVLSSILSCMLSLKSRALSFLCAIFTLVSFSNFSLTILSYYLATFSFDIFHLQLNSAEYTISGLTPLWNFKLLQWIPNDIALFSGLIVGSFLTFKPIPHVDPWIMKLKHCVDFFLRRVFLPILPFFIFGFLLKLKIDGTLHIIVDSYLPVLGLMSAVFMMVLLTFYMILASGRLDIFTRYLRNAFPAGLVGFSTMSSIAAMPVNLIGAAKNTNDSSIASATIPAVVNIHLMGDSLGIPILALAVMMTFGVPIPDMSVYIYFSFFFMLAKFATAAVPCGTIMIMMPVLEQRLGFNAEMSGLIMALYMLVDPLVTATSVWGNGAFAILMDRLFTRKLAES